MPYLTDIVDAAMNHIDGTTQPDIGNFAAHVQAFSHFRVNFPDGTNREAPTEDKAEELARIWLANRMSMQDNPAWAPARSTMHELGITITGFLAVTY